MRSHLRAFVLVVGALAASACSHLPGMPRATPSVAAEATPGLTPRERVRLAVELLDSGDDERASLELNAALADQPDNRSAQRLVNQISADPRTLLQGPDRAYVVRQGETMSELAQRFQGDALLFYALARYNNIEAPNQVAAGQRLTIPLRPGISLASATAPAPLDSAPVEGVVAAAPEPTPTETTARANQLRLEALRLLNTGQVDSAVPLLRRAQTMDPANAAIERDLERAERLQAALGGIRGESTP
jgi:hypothetical protein